MAKLIKVIFRNKEQSELLAEFYSESFLALCKSSINREAKLRGARVEYIYYNLKQLKSKINKEENETN